MKQVKKIWNRIYLAWLCLIHGWGYVQEQYCGCGRANENGKNGVNPGTELQSKGGWNRLLESLNAVGINTGKSVSIDINIEPRRIYVTVNYVIEDKEAGMVGHAIKDFELIEK